MTRARRTSRLGVRAIPFGRLAIVVQAVAALAFVVYLFANDNVSAPFIHQSYVLQASFDDASGLNGKDGREVTIAGVRVGKVTEVRYTDGRAVADLELDDDVRVASAATRASRSSRARHYRTRSWRSPRARAAAARGRRPDHRVRDRQPRAAGPRAGDARYGQSRPAADPARPAADRPARPGDAAARGARPPRRRRELQLAGRRRAR